MPITRARELLDAEDSTLEQFLEITRALWREYGYVCAIASYGLRADDESFEAETELLTIVVLQGRIDKRICLLCKPVQPLNTD